MDFNNIPEEVVVMEILIQLDPLSFLKYCNTTKKASKYCIPSENIQFFNVYKQIYSHYEYQQFVLLSAHDSNWNDFSLLLRHASSFDQIVDTRTFHRAFLFFARAKNEYAVEKIRNVSKDCEISRLLFVGNIIQRIEDLREIVNMTKALKNTLEETETSESVDYICRSWSFVSSMIEDNEYIADFLINNLTDDEIVKLYNETINFPETISDPNSKKRFSIHHDILGALIRKDKLDLFINITNGAIFGEYFETIVRNATLEQYRRLGCPEPIPNVNITPRDKTLYIMLVPNMTLLLASEGCKVVDLDPSEWMKLIHNFTQKREYLNHMYGSARFMSGLLFGCDYWVKIISESEYYKSHREEIDNM